MSSDAEHAVAQDVDAVTPILFWEPSEFIASIMILGLFMNLDMIEFGIIGCIGVLVVSRRMKRGAKKGMVQHWLWRMGLKLDPTFSKRFPPVWVSEFMQ